MALKRCSECGQVRSDEAFACPHCGYSREASRRKAYRRGMDEASGWLSILAAVFLITAMVGYYVVENQTLRDAMVIMGGCAFVGVALVFIVTRVKRWIGPYQ